MMKSSQPRKQRLFRFNAPMHVRQKFAHAHIAKDLVKKLNIKKRSIQVRKGDTVKVMSGKNKGRIGKVNKVDLKRAKLFVDGVIKKNAKGKELSIPIPVSNVYITDLALTDKFRKQKLGVSG